MSGFSGHGFGIGPGAGRLMADLVLARHPSSIPHRSGSRGLAVRHSRARRSVGVMLRRFSQPAGKAQVGALQSAMGGFASRGLDGLKRTAGQAAPRPRLTVAVIACPTRLAGASLLLACLALLPTGLAWARGPLLLPDSPAPALSTIDPKSLGTKGARGDSVAAAELGARTPMAGKRGTTRPRQSAGSSAPSKEATGWVAANSASCCCETAPRAIRSRPRHSCEPPRKTVT